MSRTIPMAAAIVRQGTSRLEPRVVVVVMVVSPENLCDMNSGHGWNCPAEPAEGSWPRGPTDRLVGSHVLDGDESVKRTLGSVGPSSPHEQPASRHPRPHGVRGEGVSVIGLSVRPDCAD